jgi:hypothetical protein
MSGRPSDVADPETIAVVQAKSADETTLVIIKPKI